MTPVRRKCGLPLHSINRRGVRAHKGGSAVRSLSNPFLLSRRWHINQRVRRRGARDLRETTIGARPQKKNFFMLRNHCFIHGRRQCAR